MDRRKFIKLALAAGALSAAPVLAKSKRPAEAVTYAIGCIGRTPKNLRKLRAMCELTLAARPVAVWRQRPVIEEFIWEDGEEGYKIYWRGWLVPSSSVPSH